jgi:hypothetical protein
VGVCDIIQLHHMLLHLHKMAEVFGMEVLLNVVLLLTIQHQLKCNILLQLLLMEKVGGNKEYNVWPPNYYFSYYVLSITP